MGAAREAAGQLAGLPRPQARQGAALMGGPTPLPPATPFAIDNACGFMCNAQDCSFRCKKDYRRSHVHLCEIHDRVFPAPLMVMGTRGKP